MRRYTALPLAVGFGISRPEHAAAVAELAEGVAVGSAVMRVVEQNGADLESRLEALAAGLAGAMRKS
jgi:tryptophan synthase alpha chain